MDRKLRHIHWLLMLLLSSCLGLEEDYDFPINVSVRLDNSWIYESPSSTAFLRFEIRDNAREDIQFYIDIQGTATAGEDFTDIPDIITIPAGSAEYVLPIQCIDDNIYEGDEDLIITVSPGPNFPDDVNLVTAVGEETEVMELTIGEDETLFNIYWEVPNGSADDINIRMSLNKTYDDTFFYPLFYSEEKNVGSEFNARWHQLLSYGNIPDGLYLLAVYVEEVINPVDRLDLYYGNFLVEPVYENPQSGEVLLFLTIEKSGRDWDLKN